MSPGWNSECNGTIDRERFSIDGMDSRVVIKNVCVGLGDYTRFSIAVTPINEPLKVWVGKKRPPRLKVFNNKDGGDERWNPQALMGSLADLQHLFVAERDSSARQPFMVFVGTGGIEGGDNQK